MRSVSTLEKTHKSRYVRSMDDLQFEIKKAFFQQKLGISEHRQFEILETAMALIKDEGFEQLSFQKLAKKCKVSRTLIHHYFKTKEDLVIRLLELSTFFLQRYVQSELAKETDPKKHYQVYCCATIDWPVLFPQQATGLLLFLYLCTFNSEMKKRNDSLSALGRQKIKLLLAEAGLVNQRIEDTAQTTQTLLTGCYLVLLSENHRPEESIRIRQSTLKTCLLISK